MKKIYKDIKVGIIDSKGLRHSILIIGEKDDDYIVRTPYNRFKKTKIAKSKVRIAWPQPK